MPMSLRQALRLARRRGLTVEPQRKTGEIRIVHRGRVLKVNARKKDAPRCLTVLLKKVAL